MREQVLVLHSLYTSAVFKELHLANVEFFFLGRSLAYGKGGLYCKAPRAHLRHARAALATAPQRRPKGHYP